MIGKNIARWLIACGCFAAIVGALGTIALALSVHALDSLNVMQSVILLALAYGIFRASRVAAIVALLIFVIQRLSLYGTAVAFQSARGGAVMTGFWISVTFFSALYVLGVIGTFAWQAESTVPIQWKATPEPTAERKEKKSKVAAVRDFCSACSGSGKTPGTDADCPWCSGAGVV